MLALDHVVLAARDLDAAARLLGLLGLQSYPGGRHPGLGTANRVVPLADAYLELMAVVDRTESGAWTELIDSLATEAGRPALWCVRTDELDAEAARLGLAAVPMARELPDGSTLSWRLAGVEAAVAEPFLPFFIEWDDPTRHPARRGEPQGRIVRLELGGDEARLHDWLGGAEAPVRVLPGAPALVAVELDGGRRF